MKINRLHISAIAALLTLAALCTLLSIPNIAAGALIAALATAAVVLIFITIALATKKHFKLMGTLIFGALITLGAGTLKLLQVLAPLGQINLGQTNPLILNEILMIALGAGIGIIMASIITSIFTKTKKTEMQRKFKNIEEVLKTITSRLQYEQKVTATEVKTTTAKNPDHLSKLVEQCRAINRSLAAKNINIAETTRNINAADSTLAMLRPKKSDSKITSTNGKQSPNKESKIATDDQTKLKEAQQLLKLMQKKIQTKIKSKTATKNEQKLSQLLNKGDNHNLIAEVLSNSNSNSTLESFIDTAADQDAIIAEVWLPVVRATMNNKQSVKDKEFLNLYKVAFIDTNAKQIFTAIIQEAIDAAKNPKCYAVKVQSFMNNPNNPSAKLYRQINNLPEKVKELQSITSSCAVAPLVLLKAIVNTINGRSLEYKHSEQLTSDLIDQIEFFLQHAKTGLVSKTEDCKQTMHQKIQAMLNQRGLTDQGELKKTYKTLCEKLLSKIQEMNFNTLAPVEKQDSIKEILVKVLTKFLISQLEISPPSQKPESKSHNAKKIEANRRIEDFQEKWQTICRACILSPTKITPDHSIVEEQKVTPEQLKQLNSLDLEQLKKLNSLDLGNTAIAKLIRDDREITALTQAFTQIPNETYKELKTTHAAKAC